MVIISALQMMNGSDYCTGVAKNWNTDGPENVHKRSLHCGLLVHKRSLDSGLLTHNLEENLMSRLSRDATQGDAQSCETTDFLSLLIDVQRK